MAVNIITTDDLQQFKLELLEDLTEFIVKHQQTPRRQWLKSHEVRRILTISPNTLHSLRERGKLPFSKLGGVIYYKYDDVIKMLEKHKTDRA